MVISKRNRKAVALMLTLLATAICLVLVSAFFALNRDQIALRSVGEQQIKAQQAILSAVEYARMRLEVDERWGVPGAGTARNLSSPALTVFENDAMPAGNATVFSSVGILPNEGGHFQVSFVDSGSSLRDLSNGRFSDASIAANPSGPGSWVRVPLQRADVAINYLAGTALHPPLLESLSTSPMRTVLPGTCLLQVTGYYRGVARVADLTLSVERPTDASFQAGGTMAVDVDPSVAGRDGLWNVASLLSEKNRIESGGRMILRGPTAGRPALRFRTANGVAATSSDIEVSQNGIYRVDDTGDGRLNVQYADTPVGVNVSAANAHTNGRMRPGIGVGAVNDISSAVAESQLRNPAFRSLSLPGGNYTFTSPNELRGPSGTFRDRIVDGGQVVAQIRNNQLIFGEGVNVEFRGATNIDAATGQSASLLMGYETGSNWGAWLPWDSEGTFVKVTNGDLSIDGSLSGKGSLMATGNGTRQGSVVMRGRSQLSADPDAAVTVFAEKNIKVTAPDARSQQFFSTDFPAISSALHTYAGTRGASVWNGGTRPLEQFASLGSDQDFHTQGGRTPVADSVVNASVSIKTAPISGNITELKGALAANFPVMTGNSTVTNTAIAEYDALFTRFAGPAGDELTVGRYLRLREFLREMEVAAASNGTIPLPSADLTSANVSMWADPAQGNEVLNDLLKAEISFFDRKADSNHRTLRNFSNNDLVPSGVAMQPGSPYNNTLSSEMNGRDAKWTGFLYARGSVAIDGGLGTLDVRGSLVARHEMAISNVSSVTSIYDPAYLRSVSQFMAGSHPATKLSLTFFRIR